MNNFVHLLDQWFSSGVPRHTRVQQRGVRGAAKFWIIVFLLIFYYIACHKLSFFNPLRGASKIFLRPEGCREPKKGLKNTVLDRNFKELIQTFKNLQELSRKSGALHNTRTDVHANRPAPVGLRAVGHGHGLRSELHASDHGCRINDAIASRLRCRACKCAWRHINTWLVLRWQLCHASDIQASNNTHVVT